MWTDCGSQPSAVTATVIEPAPVGRTTASARPSKVVHVLPRRPVTTLDDLDDEHCRSLALVVRDVVRRYDALWSLSLIHI